MARVAVIDLGTNSTRLLIADVVEDSVVDLERRSTVTRLGDGVDGSGRLTDAAIERVYAAVAEYRSMIDRLSTDRVAAVATSAVRDAANREQLTAGLMERFQIEARAISGDEEALLTFLGATAAHPGDGSATLVIDVGGGSTELVVGRPGEAPGFHVSTQAGSVRQSERHLHSDPPGSAELAALRDEVRGIIERGVPADVRSAVGRGLAVAGTPTSLAAIDQRLDPYDADRVDGYLLGRARCEEILDALATVPLEQRRRVVGLHSDRAPTIVAGAAIMLEAMRAFKLDRVETSEADLLRGMALRGLDITL